MRTRFGAVVRAPRTGMHEFEEDTPIVPYDFGESLAGGAVTAYEVNAISPDESAFHIPAVNALAIADGAIRYGEDLSSCRTTHGRPRATKAGRRAHSPAWPTSSTSTSSCSPTAMPIASGGRDALQRFAS